MISFFYVLLDVNVFITSNRSIVLLEKNYNSIVVDCAVDYQPKRLLKANNYIITVDDNDNNTVREIVISNESIIVVEFDSPGLKHIECSISLNIVNTTILTSNYSDNITVYVKSKCMILFQGIIIICL